MNRREFFAGLAGVAVASVAAGRSLTVDEGYLEHVINAPAVPPPVWTPPDVWNFMPISYQMEQSFNDYPRIIAVLRSVENYHYARRIDVEAEMTFVNPDAAWLNKLVDRVFARGMSKPMIFRWPAEQLMQSKAPTLDGMAADECRVIELAHPVIVRTVEGREIGRIRGATKYYGEDHGYSNMEHGK